MNAISTLIEHGGFAAWMIFAAGFALIVLSAERLITLYSKLSHNVTHVMDSVRSKVLERNYTEALQVCNSQVVAPEVNVIKHGLLAVESGREAMKSALGGAVLEVTHLCEKRVQFIALIANVATLLGLLGTISGLIKTFGAIANADPAEKGKMLGIGISEAMYATAAGLFIGIAAMIVHTLCTAKCETIIGNAQDAGLKLITWIEQSERADQK